MVVGGHLEVETQYIQLKADCPDQAIGPGLRVEFQGRNTYRICGCFTAATEAEVMGTPEDVLTMTRHLLWLNRAMEFFAARFDSAHIRQVKFTFACKILFRLS